MKQSASVYLIIIASLYAGVTYAATEEALWGQIDKPMEEPKPAAVKVGEIGIPAPKAEDQKSTCDMLSNQTDLSKDAQVGVMKSQNVPDEYKSLLATPDSTNSLYKQYREDYLKKYCSK
jgi:hypothetical protein